MTKELAERLQDVFFEQNPKYGYGEQEAMGARAGYKCALYDYGLVAREPCSDGEDCPDAQHHAPTGGMGERWRDLPITFGDLYDALNKTQMVDDVILMNLIERIGRHRAQEERGL